MIYIYAFLICGTISAIGQIISENSKLTNGHITSIFVIVGVFLSLFGWYDKLIDLGGAGAVIPITNFGHALFEGAYTGLQEEGFLGLLKGMLNNGAVLTITIILAFIMAFVFKPKH